MANNNVQQHYQTAAQQQGQLDQQQGNSSAYHCKECGIYLNSAQSLEVHLQYHKENLLNKWATQAATSGQHNNTEETNNNTKSSHQIKREFIPNTIAAAADSSDSTTMKKSPDYANRSTPETNNTNNTGFGHPQRLKVITALLPHSVITPISNSITNAIINLKSPLRVPLIPTQPTPSPSPKQCDKCGYVCESATQLIEHLNVAHPPTPAPHPMSSYQNFMFGNTEIKVEDDAQSEILDLDSHKVHQVYSEEEKRQQQNGELSHNPHSVSAMLNQWPHPGTAQQQQNQQNSPQQQKMYVQDHQRMYGMPEQKMYPNGMQEKDVPREAILVASKFPMNSCRMG
ncbi:zinc finger c2h2 superfamily [Holotrichia oblita]|uniref:Zinc finger c2h2 superfamily n=1 Tax=Holotrichia oblita TaxID=644536 RepID=A0ACB9TC03_HOLOL|nr:zinc finger c2h2 superfamily [Holotrichia oblita]